MVAVRVFVEAAKLAERVGPDSEAVKMCTHAVMPDT
jgi:hypothetical protein